jgi:hypothetical protein
MALNARTTARVSRRPRQEGPPGQRQIFSHAVYGPEGRRVAVLKIGRTGRPGGNQPYAIIELSGYSPTGGELRAIPLTLLSYEGDRDILMCDLTEVALRSAPAYTGPADWLDMRWTSRLDAYFDRLGNRGS